MRKRVHVASRSPLSRRLLANVDGSAAVEFGLVALPFLALLLGALQLLILFVAQQLLETAAESSGRQILTGNAQTQAMTQPQFHALVCSKMPIILQCGNVMVDLQVATSFANADTSKPTITYDKFGNVTNVFHYNLGAQGQIVVMRLMYQWPVFNFILQLGTQSNGTHLLLATSVFRNENY